MFVLEPSERNKRKLAKSCEAVSFSDLGNTSSQRHIFDPDLAPSNGDDTAVVLFNNPMQKLRSTHRNSAAVFQPTLLRGAA